MAHSKCTSLNDCNTKYNSFQITLNEIWMSYQNTTCEGKSVIFKAFSLKKMMAKVMVNQAAIKRGTIRTF